MLVYKKQLEMNDKQNYKTVKRRKKASESER